MIFQWPIFYITGGAERVMCEFANNLIKRGHTVTVLCPDINPGQPAYPIDNKVCFKYFGGNPISFFYRSVFRSVSSWSPIKKERQLLRRFKALDAMATQLKPLLKEVTTDVFITFSPNASYILLRNLTSKVPVITMLHSSPEICFGEILGIKMVNSDAKRAALSFRRVQKQFNNYISTISRSAVIQVLLPDFISQTHAIIPSTKIVCIPNPVTQFLKAAPLEAHTIINVARIIPLKRQHLIIQAFSLLANQFPDWSVEFWGQPSIPYCNTLNDIIKKLHLIDRIKICGVTKNIEQQLNKASIFIITSTHEGFALGMVEAMSKGIPIIGLKSCSAVNSIIQNGKNGYLCEATPEALASALKKLMSDKELRNRLGTYARDCAKIYSPNHIWNQWEQLIYSVLPPKNQNNSQ